MGAFDSIYMQLPSWLGGPSEQERNAYYDEEARKNLEAELARKQAAGASIRGAPVAPGQERMVVQEGDLTTTKDATVGELIKQMEQQNNRNRTVVPNAPPRPQVPVQPVIPPAPAQVMPQRPPVDDRGVVNGVPAPSMPKSPATSLRRKESSPIAVRG